MPTKTDGTYTLRRQAPENHDNPRSALECGSEVAAVEFEAKAVAIATALQSAFGTTIFKAGEVGLASKEEI